MIELVQSPDTNRAIADGNDTIIQLRTTTGSDHFLRAVIYIDGEEFLQQSWSKDEDNLCVFNLKHLYYAYFENYFSSEIQTGFNIKPGLFKRVKIIAREYKVGFSAIVSTLELPEFYLVKNHKPQVFDDNKTVAFLDLPQENIKVSKSSGFVFPLYLKAGELLTATVLNSLGEPIYSTALNNYTTHVTQFELKFEDLEIAALGEIFVRFQTSQDSVQKKLVFINDSIYPTKQLFYLNNCGFYVPAFLLGKKENNHSLSPLSYSRFDGTEVTYDVEDVKELKLNTGYGYKDITALVHTIATSVDVRMQLEGYWERVKSETKKVQLFVDNQFIYSEALNFSRVNVANFTNENTFALIPEVADLIKEGDENAVITITKAEFLSVYLATQSATRLRIRTLPENGKISYQTTSGTYNLSDMAANNPSIIPFEIPLDDFISIQYQPNYTLFGDSLDVIKFQLGAIVLWSNVASLNLNVVDLPDANLPPNILLNSIHKIALDENGNASKIMNATITDPEGDQVEIFWEVLDGAPITFNDNTVEDPMVTINGGAANQIYQIKVTARDIDNSLVSEKIIIINTSSYAVSISSLGYVPSGHSASGFESWYNVIVSGGQPSKEVVLVYEMQAVSFDQYAVINLNENTERIIAGNNQTFDTLTLGADGRKEFQIKLVNNQQNSILNLTVSIDSVTGDQIISQFSTIALSL